MTFSEFMDAARQYYLCHPEQRYGQALVNSLYWCRQDLHKNMDNDIYYVEAQTREDLDKINAWWQEVAEKW